jgi:hypothetical protein
MGFRDGCESLNSKDISTKKMYVSLELFMITYPNKNICRKYTADLYSLIFYWKKIWPKG